MKPILDKTLIDGAGNTCRVEVHHFGASNVEAYFHDFNGAVPVRYIDGPGIIQNHVELWLANKKEQGWTEQAH